MSAENILPSAPPLYPSLPNSGSDFRLKKICDCQKEIENEISHHQKVAKKYKRVKAVCRITSSVTSVTAALLSIGGFAGALSGAGIIISVPLTSIAGLLALASAATTLANKSLVKKTEKHEKTVSLAEAKQRTISRLVSKAMKDSSITDVEFASILSEIDQYYSLKKELRRNSPEKVEEAKRAETATLREEIKKEYQKKLGSLLTLVPPTLAKN